ncbi:MAG: Fic [Microgenomates group bacterium GW2011_GWC1_43_11]|uniref:Fic n=2 Tax=Candidatus Gottesmaniibacteriota TaxID=1752720 RepID=A0A0G1IQ32_9BACT|nr:MAG: Fic [Microgenomates group bacterium GW2011_GWC1_43_11]KKT38313.1 MAG: Fic [Candidatus Gottesmanbacteria bacterium GW2011_GWB1_44_11c]KKT61068.1 MAG: Fic [Candidatus Gottesmanbacteria bacterium GW2011_GWA1_44_24b]HCM82652.1 Fic family protein [Patescibacteria group bacterium]
MNTILQRITEKKQELDAHKPLPPALVKNLEDWLKVELTYSSNAIEGNTLSRIETAEIIEKNMTAVIRGKPLKDQLEALNHAKAVEFIKRLAAVRKSHQFITEHDIQDIHRIILSGIDDMWAGKYRQTEVFIRGSNTEFPLPHIVPIEMKKFIEWLEAQQGIHPVTVAADAHYKFVAIHPFIDGNGRTTRLLMNLILLIHGYPIAIIRNEDRTAYLHSFEIIRTQHSLEPFNTLIYEGIERSLDIYLKALKHKQPVFKRFEPSQKTDLLKIGELAKKTGETIHTLRYWTKEGLLTAVDYTKGGYQLYDKTSIERVQKIRTLQREKRLTINELKKALA